MLKGIIRHNTQNMQLDNLLLVLGLGLAFEEEDTLMQKLFRIVGHYGLFDRDTFNILLVRFVTEQAFTFYKCFIPLKVKMKV